MGVEVVQVVRAAGAGAEERTGQEEEGAIGIPLTQMHTLNYVYS